MRAFLRTAAFVLFFAALAAQAQDRFAFAITDLTKETMGGWNALRKLDLSTGEYSTVILNGTDATIPVYDAGTKKLLVQQPDERYGNFLQAPFSTGVAAVAYDAKNNRLYYTPMFIDQLRYIDLKTMKVHYVTDQSFTGLGTMHNDEGKSVTRMVIAPDGTGYAITNDANTMVKFTTGKKIKIEQMGALVDDPSNNGVSIHNRCSSFGGDMIADDKGNLFILTARNTVYQVNTQTRVAKLLGTIKGLPADFTVNGAVVDGDGNLLVSSAVNNNSYFVVNPKTWEASVFHSATVFRSSDLANSNYLSTRSKNPTTTIETITRKAGAAANTIQIFPNPITTNQFTIQFQKVPVGDYTIELTDVMGRRILQQKVTLVTENATEVISLAATNAKGVYLVKVLDISKRSVHEQKVLVQ
jgi:hypothetical protein